MSRPFSYNDKNFTVIGNVVFVHALIGQVKPLQKILEIPYEIGRRLLYKTAMGFLQFADEYGSKGYQFNGTIIYADNKYYLSMTTELKQTCYATAFLILKDI